MDDLLIRLIGRVEYRFITNLPQSDVSLYLRTILFHSSLPLVLVDAPIDISSGASLWIKHDFPFDLSDFWDTMRIFEKQGVK